MLLAVLLCVCMAMSMRMALRVRAIDCYLCGWQCRQLLSCCTCQAVTVALTTVMQVFSLGSTAPGATLWEARCLLDGGNARCDKLLRELADGLPAAVETCVEAAGTEDQDASCVHNTACTLLHAAAVVDTLLGPIHVYCETWRMVSLRAIADCSSYPITEHAHE